ncbi:hypothetical protein U9M48_003906 [Paspalum notatum var. saurae]|uniref:Diphthamide biosynthesis protein 2 n=1 Tax=Paspalum notatum var. saurae TaxID=547442 RepID=A0AAQ3SH92_PASNO
MEADIGSRYEIRRTAEFLRAAAYSRVALQFPDEMLKDASSVARLLRRELASGGGVRLFVMADTAYNSCCVDEVGASHIDAQCVVSYGLEYAYALDDLRQAFEESCKSSSCNPEVQYADILCSVMSPSSSATEEHKCPESTGTSYNGHFSTFPDNRFRYDAMENQLSTDVSHLMKILRRRYYLVEKAKDVNIIGILVGTLGVAGYLQIIEQTKELIKATGKKSYTLVMGRPNSAKLANFPEGKRVDWRISFGFQGFDQFRETRNRKHNRESKVLLHQRCYVEDNFRQENEEQSETALALAEVAERALNIKTQHNDTILYQGGAISSIDYLKARSYRGLTEEYEDPAPDSILVGRTGRAADYRKAIRDRERASIS